MTKKLLSVLLAALLVCSVIPMSLVQTFAAEDTGSAVADYPAITLDEGVEVTVDTPGDRPTYKFIPEESGDYMFYSTGTADTCGYLYDSDFAEIDYNDDNNTDINFCIKCYLEANKTYYITAKFYSSDRTGEFTLFVKAYDSGEGFSALELGGSADVSFSMYNPDATFVIQPEESGFYRFYTTAGYPIKGTVYTSSYSTITESGYDDSELSLSANLTAGRKYLLYLYMTEEDFEEFSSGVDFTVYSEAVEIEQLYSGGKATAVISKPGETVTFKFVPETTDYYAFYSTGGRDTKAALYDAQMSLIEDDDDGGDGQNFRISKELQAGCVYYLEVRYYSDENTGQFSVFTENTVVITEMELLSPPENAVLVRGHERDFNDYWGLKVRTTWSDGETIDWKYGDDNYIRDEEVYYSYNDEDEKMTFNCGDQSVVIPMTVIDNPVNYIEITSGAEATVTVNTHGYWSTGNDGEKFYYYDIYNIFDTITACVHYNDGTTESVELGYKLNGYYFSNNRNQYSDPYTVGENKITVSYLGAEAELTLTVTESPVASLELVTPSNLVLIENMDGYIEERYDKESGDYVSFFYYALSDYDAKDALVKINYKNGTSTTAHPGDEIEGAEVRVTTNQYDKPWTIGENTILITYMGAEVEDTVTIIKSPVKSIEPLDNDGLTFFENTQGYWSTNYNPETGGYDLDVYYYSYFDALSGKEFLIRFNDGSAVIATIYDYVRGYEITSEANQYDNPWTVGGDNYVTVEFMGVETKIPVTITESPVAKFELVKPTSKKLIENGDGYWDKKHDGELDEEYFYYTFRDEDLTDAEFKITFTDGTSQIAHIGDNVNGFRVLVDNYEGKWKLGSDNIITVAFMGKTAEMPIEVIETPASSIVINSAPSRTYIYGDKYFGGNTSFYASDYTGLSFTVYFKNGTQKTYTDADIEGDYIDGHCFNISNDREQKLGENEVKFEYMGLSATYNVNVIESPIADLEILELPANGFDDEYYLPDWRGLKFKVTYKNGTSKVVTLDEDDIIFEPTMYMGIYAYFELDGIVGRLMLHYQMDNSISACVIYADKMAEKSGMEVLESKRISDVKVEDFSETAENMLVKITYEDGTNESYRLGNTYSLGEGFYRNGNTWLAYTPRGVLSIRIYDDESPHGNDLMYLLGKYIKKDSEEPEKDRFLGDVDGDGAVTVTDAYILQKYLAEFNVDNKKEIVMCGDVNRDGILSVSDVTLIQQFVAGMDVGYPIGNKI